MTDVSDHTVETTETQRIDGPPDGQKDAAKYAAISAIHALVGQRNRAEDEHRKMLADLLAIAMALNCEPSRKACEDKIVELYQENSRLKIALGGKCETCEQDRALD